MNIKNEIISYWNEQFILSNQEQINFIHRKSQLAKAHQKRIEHVQGWVKLLSENNDNDQVNYDLHFRWLVKDKDYFYHEEEYIPFMANIENDKVMAHRIREPLPYSIIKFDGPKSDETSSFPRYSYNRREAVRYAESWWDSYNPAFKYFSDNDCTNYISQCLFAGGVPMNGAPNRNKGWWYNANSWSFSWSVAHAFRWHLSGSNAGLQGSEVDDAKELMLGDVICYDFEGDGKWDHTTIVTAKDSQGMPLVNAHTNNSRHRYWNYKDSYAWTPNCAYRFFRIGEKN
ncbi:amidase domain-containing protein [Saliterribacillus persicus]|uniref:Putative amidase-like protein n=1 Tax=Saliterribacillus persicus TaxID=930114 RepID=A0A368Y3K8_9BACI|nr:amidase domain-containing protein [Saliterribacillus persicus]RCW74863.1 putative amidase-like protein [Saliterribacillus persicus]